MSCLRLHPQMPPPPHTGWLKDRLARIRQLFTRALLLAVVPAAPALAQQGDGISSAALSRCAGKLGTDTRQSDPAFGAIMLDGVPWITIERTESKIGTQAITTTMTGTGILRRRDGTSVPVRFTCLLDAKGQALMVHTSRLMRRLGDTLPPSVDVVGWAAHLERPPLPKGIELRVQLLDITDSPAGEILTEQVVRSGWQTPVPFMLSLPKDTPLEGRKIAIAARLVLAHQTLFWLREPRVLGIEDLRKPVELTLDKVEAVKK